VKWTFDLQLADGNAIHAVKWTRLARDSAGRTRFENPMGCDRGVDGQLHARTDVTLYDPATRTTTVWTVGFTSEKVANVSHQPVRVARPAPTAEEQAEVAERQREAVERQKLGMAEFPANVVQQTIHLGTATIGGLSADGTRLVNTIPAGSEGNEQTIEYITEYWMSKDLRMTVRWVTDSPMGGRSAFPRAIWTCSRALCGLLHSLRLALRRLRLKSHSVRVALFQSASPADLNFMKSG
jgi:hypothetical protein